MAAPAAATDMVLPAALKKSEPRKGRFLFNWFSL